MFVAEWGYGPPFPPLGTPLDYTIIHDPLLCPLLYENVCLTKKRVKMVTLALGPKVQLPSRRTVGLYMNHLV